MTNAQNVTLVRLWFKVVGVLTIRRQDISSFFISPTATASKTLAGKGRQISYVRKLLCLV